MRVFKTSKVDTRAISLVVPDSVASKKHVTTSDNFTHDIAVFSALNAIYRSKQSALNGPIIRLLVEPVTGTH